MTGWWFSLGTLVFSTNKTGHNEITKILLKVTLITINKPTELYFTSLYILQQECYPIETFLSANHKIPRQTR